MEEGETCCCGARRWTLVIGWFQMIIGILALLVLGTMSLIFHDKDLHYELELSPTISVMIMVIWYILAILSIVIAYVLIRGCKNKTPKQLHIWVVYVGISLVILIVVFFANSSATHGKQDQWRISPKTIFSLCIDVAIQIFSIWVVGIHKREIEASSETVVPYKSEIYLLSSTGIIQI